MVHALDQDTSWSALWRSSRYVQVRNPQGRPRTHLRDSGLGTLWNPPGESGKCHGGRRMFGLTCYHHDLALDRWGAMDGWIDIFVPRVYLQFSIITDKKFLSVACLGLLLWYQKASIIKCPWILEFKFSHHDNHNSWDSEQLCQSFWGCTTKRSFTEIRAQKHT